MNYIHETGIPAGGAFPIVVNGKHAYTVCVSGLHEGKDHEIIVNALSNYLKRDIPPFKKGLF